MIECNTIVDSHNCAIQSYTCCGTAPSPEQLSTGIKPYDTLPAEWWNWMWNDTNTALAEAHTTFGSAVNEILTVLNCTGITPDSECTTQLKEAIYCLHRTTFATTSEKGTVKSSLVKGNIQIKDDGTMIANGLGNASYTIVDTINNIKQYHDTCTCTLRSSVSTKDIEQLRCICLGAGVSDIKQVNNGIISLGLGNAALCNVSDLAIDISDYATPGGTVCYAACVGTATSAVTATYGTNAVCRYWNDQCCVSSAYYVTTCPGTINCTTAGVTTASLASCTYMTCFGYSNSSGTYVHCPGGSYLSMCFNCPGIAIVKPTCYCSGCSYLSWAQAVVYVPANTLCELYWVSQFIAWIRLY